jgi:hypothetical protein
MILTFVAISGRATELAWLRTGAAEALPAAKATAAAKIVALINFVPFCGTRRGGCLAADSL